MEDWLTLASPLTMTPSRGMRLPVRTMMTSPTCTSATFTRTSWSPAWSQTLSTLRLMVWARSATDFLWVHSSRISPIFRRNMMLLAVPLSPRRRETEMATASSTGTWMCPWSRQARPRFKYLIQWKKAMTVRTGAGRKTLERMRRITAVPSLSWNSRFRARLLLAGASSPCFS